MSHELFIVIFYCYFSFQFLALASVFHRLNKSGEGDFRGFHLFALNEHPCMLPNSNGKGSKGGSFVISVVLFSDRISSRSLNFKVSGELYIGVLQSTIVLSITPVSSHANSSNSQSNLVLCLFVSVLVNERT